MRKSLFAVALAGAILATTVPAGAEMASGDTPPEFTGKEFVNTAPCSFKSLRGHVILVEIFRTWWGPCKTQVGHLDELQEKYKAKGFTVLALTNEGRDLVDAFVANTGAKHPIVIEEGDSGEAFDIKGYPSAFLIDPKGKIAVAGRPTDSQIEDALKDARLAPELPKALQSVESSLKKEKYAEARAKIVKLQEGGTLTADSDKEAAEELVKWIDFLAQSGLDSAKQLGERGDWLAATKTLEDTVKAFKGMPQSVEADTQLKAILADKTKKEEVTAAKRLAEARAKQRDKEMKPKEALPLFRAIANKYENTKAGKAAKKIADELELLAGGK